MAVRDFDAHITRKIPKKVKFTTREGERVRFTAQKPTRVKTHVHFKTHDCKKA